MREGGGAVTLPMAQVVMRAICVNAGKGQVRAQKLFIEIVQRLEAEAVRQNWEALESAIELKAALEREVERRTKKGRTDLSDLPVHPDDILIDVHTGEADVLSPERKQAARRIAQDVAARRRMIADARAALAAADAKPHVVHSLKGLIERTQAGLDAIVALLPAWILEM